MLWFFLTQNEVHHNNYILKQLHKDFINLQIMLIFFTQDIT